MLARNRFLHWPTDSSMPFCDMLADVSMKRCFKSPVSRTGVLYNVHVFLHQPTNSVVNRIVWHDKIQCFLLKELDCFTTIQWRHNMRHFWRSYLQAKWVKVKGQGKFSTHIIFESVLMLFGQNYQNKFATVETTACQSWRVFWDTVESAFFSLYYINYLSFTVTRQQ